MLNNAKKGPIAATNEFEKLTVTSIICQARDKNIEIITDGFTALKKRFAAKFQRDPLGEFCSSTPSIG